MTPEQLEQGKMEIEVFLNTNPLAAAYAQAHDQAKDDARLRRLELMVELGQGAVGSVAGTMMDVARKVSLDGSAAIIEYFYARKFVDCAQVIQVYTMQLRKGKGTTYFQRMTGSMDNDEFMHLFRDRKLHPNELVKAFGDAMRGISAIHSKGCLHCDVKLGNFLYRVDAEGKVDVKIGDLGSCCLIDGRPSNIMYKVNGFGEVDTLNLDETNEHAPPPPGWERVLDFPSRRAQLRSTESDVAWVGRCIDEMLYKLETAADHESHLWGNVMWGEVKTKLQEFTGAHFKFTSDDRCFDVRTNILANEGADKLYKVYAELL